MQDPTTINEVAEMLNGEQWFLPQTAAKACSWNLIAAMEALGFRFDSGAGNMAGAYWDIYAGAADICLTTKGWRVRWETPETVKFEYFEKSGDAIAWAYEGFIKDAG